MAFDEREVRRVMRTRLKTTPGIPTESRLAWENHTFTPPSIPTSNVAGALWVREWQEVFTEILSSSGMIEATGQTTYGVYAPRGRGTAELDTLVQSIADSFKPGQSLTSPDIRVILVRTSRSGLRSPADHDAWVYKAVNIQWRVFTLNSTPQS